MNRGRIVAFALAIGLIAAACQASGSARSAFSPSPSEWTTPTASADSQVPDRPPASASAAATPSPSAQATKARWKVEASMLEPLDYRGAIVLRDGRILIVGSEEGCYPSGGPGPESLRSEIWDPATGRWSRTADRTTPRYGTAIALLADGRVLLAGGWSGGYRSLRTVSIYDPRTDVWLPGASLRTARNSAWAVTLGDGRVLIVGGSEGRSVELYDPLRDAWTTGPPLPPRVTIDSATVLRDGRVLVLATTYRATPDGDEPQGIAELFFDPHRNAWSKKLLLKGPASWMLGADPPVVVALLTDGGALLSVGGERPSAKMYRLDPKTLRLRATGSMLHQRSNPVWAVLADGRVLAAGGATKISVSSRDVITTRLTRTAEIYDPVTGHWSATASMPSARQGALALTLRDGSVLVLGGDLGYQGGMGAPMCPEYLNTVVRFIPGNR